MWTSRFRIRPVSHCKEGCSIEPVEIIDGRKRKKPLRKCSGFLFLCVMSDGYRHK